MIAATIDNGLAGIGVAPRVTILPVRVLGIDGFGTSSDIAEGIRFAVDAGARVINLSLGGTGIAQVTREALQYAYDHRVVVVAAAGNDADDPDVFAGDLGSDVSYPARVPTVSPSAPPTSTTSAPATRTTARRSTWWRRAAARPTAAAGQRARRGARHQLRLRSGLRRPLYGGFWATGTSFACPHAAGTAALLVSLGVDDPAAVRAMLELTTRDLLGPGFDLPTGHGLLDAAAAHRGLGFTN